MAEFFRSSPLFALLGLAACVQSCSLRLLSEPSTETTTTGSVPSATSPTASISAQGQAAFDAGTYGSGVEWNGGRLRLTSFSASAREMTVPNDPDFDLNGLVGYWRLNESAAGQAPGGKDAEDFSGQGNHGVAANLLSFAYTGTLNGAFEFDNSTLTLPASAATQDPPFSISFWFRTEQTGTAILHKGNATNGWELSQPGGTTRFQFISHFSGTDIDTTTGAGIFNTSSWCHVVVTWDGGASFTDVKLYVDRRYVEWPSGTSATGAYASDAGLPLVIGEMIGGGGAQHSQFDEVMLFNRELSADEVAQLYNLQKGPFVHLAPRVYTSMVFDSGDDMAQADRLSWVPHAPYGKALIQGAETAYATDNLDLTSMILHYTFDDPGTGTVANGTTIVDSTGNYNGTFATTGAPGVYEQGKIGGSLKFDGDAHIDLAEVTEVSQIPAVTLLSYLKESSQDGTPHALFTQGPNGFNDVEFAAYFNFLAFDVGNGVADTYDFSGVNRAIGQWLHFAAVFDGTQVADDDKEKIYVDGVELSFLMGGGYGAATPNTSGVPALAVNGLQGNVDELAVITRALSAAEVQAAVRRSSLHARFQLRSCTLADCSDGTFVGPDGTAATYYSEAMNTSLGLPDLPIANLPTGRYYQFRLELSSDDSGFTPEIESVQIHFAQ